MTTTPAADFPALPYPGKRPTSSYVLDDETVIRLVTDGPAPDWRLDQPSAPLLSDWLLDRDLAAMTDRIPLLSYGSNACPGKLLALHEDHDLDGPVVMSRCTIRGMAAVWCRGPRGDGVVPATLAALAGQAEEHFIWWVSPDQWDALDACEGRSSGYYDLVRLASAQDRAVLDEADDQIHGVFAYVGARSVRYPVLDVDGRPQRMSQPLGLPRQPTGLTDTPPPTSLGRHLPPYERPFRIQVRA